MAGRLETRTWQHNNDSSAPASYRRACHYHTFIPDMLAGLDPKFDGETSAAFSEAENAIRALNHVAQPALDPLARLLLRTESIASSKVEGMQIGSRTLAKAEVIKETGAGKISDNAREILSNIDAMQLAVEKAAANAAISIDHVKAIHKELMATAPHNHIAGKIRTVQNWIGGNDYNPCGADYVPPPPEHVEPLLMDLCEAINSDRLPALVQAALVHAQFETIHPFDDGNGRTGRALIHVVLRKRELAVSYVPPISVVLARSKDRYIAGLNTFREPGGEMQWVRQFAESTTTAANLAGRYLRATQKLVEAWKGKLASLPDPPRQDSVAWKIIDVLPGVPIITALVAKSETRRALPSIYEGIDKLVEAGVLAPVSEGRRNRSWEAVGLFDLLSHLEAGEMPDESSPIL